LLSFVFAAPDSRMNVLFNQANTELLQHIKGADGNAEEQTIEIEPIRFEDAMTVTGPPPLLSVQSMDRVFVDRRHFLDGPIPDLSTSEFPTSAALTSAIQSNTNKEDKEEEEDGKLTAYEI